MTSSFAQKHLESLGWESGQGLGRQRQGISDAIKPELKRDQAGLGHIGEEFGFAWWDHCFTKAAKKIKVEHCEKPMMFNIRIAKRNLGAKLSGEVKVRAEKTTITTKLESKRAPTSLLYGSFVAAKKDGEDDDDDGAEDHSTLSKLTDEEVFRRCGGRTAHKGARHNISQVAKLKRSKEDKLLKSLAAESAVGGGENESEVKEKKKKSAKAEKEKQSAKKSKSKGVEGDDGATEKVSKKSKKEEKGGKKDSKKKSKRGGDVTAAKKSLKASDSAKSSKKDSKKSEREKGLKEKGKKELKGSKKDSKESKKRKSDDAV